MSNSLRVTDAVPDSGWRSALFTASPVALALVDLDGVLVSVNNSFVSLLGIPRSEIAGEPWTSFVDPRHAEVIRAEIGQLSEAETEHFTCEARFLTQSSSVTAVLHGRALYDNAALIGHIFYAVPLVCPVPSRSSANSGQSRDYTSEPVVRPRTWKEAIFQKPTELLLTVIVIAVLVGKEGVERFLTALLELIVK